MKAIIKVDESLEFTIVLLMECERYEIVQAESTILALMNEYIKRWKLEKLSMVGLLFMDSDGSFAKMQEYYDTMSIHWECIMFDDDIYALCSIE